MTPTDGQQMILAANEMAEREMRTQREAFKDMSFSDKPTDAQHVAARIIADMGCNGCITDPCKSLAGCGCFDAIVSGLTAAAEVGRPAIESGPHSCSETDPSREAGPVAGYPTDAQIEAAARSLHKDLEDFWSGEAASYDSITDSAKERLAKWAKAALSAAAEVEPTIPFYELKARWMEDPEFRKAYEAAAEVGPQGTAVAQNESETLAIASSARAKGCGSSAPPAEVGPRQRQVFKYSQDPIFGDTYDDITAAEEVDDLPHDQHLQIERRQAKIELRTAILYGAKLIAAAIRGRKDD